VKSEGAVGKPPYRNAYRLRSVLPPSIVTTMLASSGLATSLAVIRSTIVFVVLASSGGRFGTDIAIPSVKRARASYTLPRLSRIESIREILDNVTRTLKDSAVQNCCRLAAAGGHKYLRGRPKRLASNPNMVMKIKGWSLPPTTPFRTGPGQ
jgi:hypothetical protein